MHHRKCIHWESIRLFSLETKSYLMLMRAVDTIKILTCFKWMRVLRVWEREKSSFIVRWYREIQEWADREPISQARLLMSDINCQSPLRLRWQMAGPVTSGVNIAGEVRFLMSNFNLCLDGDCINGQFWSAYFPLLNPIFADIFKILTCLWFSCIFLVFFPMISPVFCLLALCGKERVKA